ncbi:5204_t:CDS:1, partial [Dentiscutata erythropus]
DESLSENAINTGPNSDNSNKNSDTDHSIIDNSNKTSNVKVQRNVSWIWQYFRRRCPLKKWKTRGNCTMIIKSKKFPDGQEYGQLVKTQGST